LAHAIVDNKLEVSFVVYRQSGSGNVASY